jgi:hypothetical protein
MLPSFLNLDYVNRERGSIAQDQPTLLKDVLADGGRATGFDLATAGQLEGDDVAVDGDHLPELLRGACEELAE